MNSRFLFALILLVTLSVASAIQFEERDTNRKDCTKFTKCKGGNVPSVKVSLTPDPLKPQKNSKFTVSGKVTSKITSGFVFVSFLNKNKEERGFDFIPILKTNADHSFSVNKTIQSPASKQDMVAVVVKVLNYKDDHHSILLACAEASP
ncbi:10148_t:CDS:1 [Cetraspora pellucida]|uniref:10148_t:CDS:1 n=1 Tax=Cetraspora pellucida TaxID=1433469 RepID=A0ACA9LB53_9GLOM|nr:10148_t:CDS:1 [Cetraspora pellucida]